MAREESNGSAAQENFIGSDETYGAIKGDVTGQVLRFER
jgi:hypothetical protein